MEQRHIERILLQQQEDRSGRYEDSCGMSESAEIPQERNDEEAQRSPRGKRSNLKRRSELVKGVLNGMNKADTKHLFRKEAE
ncbi:hypothetical protein [Priestia koreensis]|uniref:hypothetical protein n=1 Tax=Priestia koreensis TaxID=284581 RepID=UPI00345A03BC